MPIAARLRVKSRFCTELVAALIHPPERREILRSSDRAEAERKVAAVQVKWEETFEALAVAHADQLDGSPPRVRAIAKWIRNAMIVPIVRDTEIHDRHRKKYLSRPSSYRRAAE